MLERRRNLDLKSFRHNGVDELRERAESADASAIDSPPEHERDDCERGKRVPGHVVREDRQIAGQGAEHVDDGHELALVDAHVSDRSHERDVLERRTFAQEADRRERREGDEERDVGQLIGSQIEQAGIEVLDLVEVP